MKLLKSPNQWSCVATSFAMLFDLTVEEVWRRVGHDGSEIWWPNVKFPNCCRSIAIQELLEIAYDLGYGLIEIHGNPALYSDDATDIRHLFPDPDARIDKWMSRGSGLLAGRCGLKNDHMCAWNGKQIYDPICATPYGFDDNNAHLVAVDYFYLKVKIERSDQF